MGYNLAKEYADSLVSEIRDNTREGYPFGKSEDEVDDYSGEPVELSAYDYLQDVLSIIYSVDADRSYRGARILIGYGGPNVWIDTNTNALEVYWGETVTRYLPSEFIDYLDEALEELWNMGG
jgi:hypothetical protein